MDVRLGEERIVGGECFSWTGGHCSCLRAVVDPYNPIRVRQKDHCEYKARL